MIVSGEDYEAEAAASAENRRASQRANIGIRCPQRKADWEFGETVWSNNLVDQRSCRHGCTAM